MLTEAATATCELIFICRDHEQHEASASLDLVLIAARRAQATLAVCWRELGNQALIDDELSAIDTHLYHLIDVLERMEEEPQPSYRAELAAASEPLHVIDEALRELLEHRAVIRHLPALFSSVVAAATALHVLQRIACRREDSLQRWPELLELSLVSKVQLDQVIELVLAELRTLSDARFSAKRWRGKPTGQPMYGYVFEEHRYTPSPAAQQLSGQAMIEHQERAFATFPGVAEIQLLLEHLARVPAGRAAA
jgi:hypothetical protein